MPKEAGLPDFTQPHGISSPRPEEFVKDANFASKLANDFKALAETSGLAITAEGIRAQNAAITDADNKYGGLAAILARTMQFKEVGQLPPRKADWIGLDKAGMYRLPNQAATDAIIDRPLGSGPALVNIYPMGALGSRIVWREYAGRMRSWDRSVSTTSANSTEWELLSTPTRRVLHQLSMPGNGNLRDTETTRHVRVPVKLPCAVGHWDLTFKNFNEQLGTNYGDLDFADIYVGKAAVGTFGQLTAQFDGAPTSLGKPTASGSGATRRYMITGISFTFEANTEYLISYGYTNPNPATATHMGIGGSWLGTDPSMTGRFEPPVSNSWSPNTPLDVYLTLHAPTTVPAYAYLGSSSETGLGSAYPLRDVWGWKHAEASGALPALMGHSGSTIQAWSSASRYTWQKLSSTFDKVDKAYIAAGSNDAYLGRTLAQMKTDATALANLIRANLSDAIVYANIFPRRTEAAAVKTVRTAWNEYLTTLPDGATGALDRTKAVSTDAGLMRPELDSGDGTHLTTQGQAYLGAAAIVGAEYGGNLNRYTVSESAGRTVKVWDYLNNREQLIYGDTGERDISGLITADGAATTFTLRRSGNICTMSIYSFKALASGGGGIAVLPVGFRPVGTFGAPAQGLSSRWQVTNSGNVQAYDWAADTAVVGSLTWTTSDAWPTTLPGTAVGAIPYQ